MKNSIKIYLAALLLIVIGAACEGFLEELPRTEIVEENFFQSDDDAFLGLFGAYDPMQWQQVDGTNWHFRFVYGDIVSDDAVKGGSDINDIFDWNLLETFQGNSRILALENDWRKNYIGIARVNALIQGIQGNSAISESVQTRVIAEARFLRAFYYFDLVTMFGGVPIVTEPLAPSEFRQPRASAAEVYDQVIEPDFMAAIEELPTKSQIPQDELGRATRGAAQGLLLRAYVYQQEWAQAETLAQTIISSGEYSLNADYETIFTQAGEHGEGSLFEINFSSGTGDGWGANNALNGLGNSIDDGGGSAIGQFQRARGQFGGWGFNSPTQEFVDEFEVNDPRLESSVFQVGDQMGDRGVFLVEDADAPFLFWPRKYFLNLAEEAATGVIALNGPHNWRVLRFSDVLLMHAEAAFQNGNEGVALNSLNQVRARARRNAVAGAIPDVNATGTALLNAIYHERRVELGLEGLRFFDLVRTGRAPDVLGPLGFQAGTHEVFPIPGSEVIVSGNVIEQNPGYN